MTQSDSIKLKNDGYCIIPNWVSLLGLDLLKAGLEKSFKKHREIQIDNGNDIVTEGVALHILLDDPIFLELLEYLFVKSGLGEWLRTNYFKSPFILNSISGLNNLPNEPNFSSIIHRDLRFYTGEIPVMINALVMVDDFTEQNGPTLLLPYSHLSESKPSDEYFREHSIRAIGKAGSVLLFNANIWHCSSLNTSDKDRRAIPITLTKSLIKQLLDYPRALGYNSKKSFSEPMQQLLGYDARVPANLDEWYQPSDNRFYKKIKINMAAQGVHKITADFEQALCKYTGAPYAIALDNASNALFLALLYDFNSSPEGPFEVTIPANTYPSVPCEIIHAGGKVNFYDFDPSKQRRFENTNSFYLKGAYNLFPSNVWDSALRFTHEMYIPGMHMCLSFTGPYKHLKLGKGGAILTDDETAYKWFKKARFSGRDECSYHVDEFDKEPVIGWNFYMMPEIAARGLLLMGQFYNQDGTPRSNPDLELPYPDLSKFKIYKQ